MLFPSQPTIDNYYRLFQDPRILIGYKTTLLILFLGVPINLFLTTSLAYGLSRTNFPGGKFIFYAVLLTMLFNGGIVPMYLLMLQLGLTKNIWSVILAYGVNTFYFIIMRTYMTTLPDSLIESAKIDGADEMRILFKIILPLSKPILATVLLFYAVDRWNEWFNAMVFLRRNDLIPLQLVLRIHRHGLGNRELPVHRGAAYPQVYRGNSNRHHHGHHASDHVLFPVPAKILCQGHHDRRNQGIDN